MRMKRTLSSALLLLGILILADSCKHDPWVPTNFNPSPDDTVTTSGSCDPDTVYFVNDVLPIFQSSCAISGCHDAITAEEGVVLTDYQHILSTGHVHAGDPHGSEVYQVLNETGEEQMPPPSSGVSLTQAQEDAIYTWILQGAANNACTEAACDSVGATYSNDVLSILQLHCLSCHSGAATSGGGIKLDSYAQVANYANNGFLLGVITHEPGYSAMPQGGAMLDDCKIGKIRNWINEGAQNN